MAFFLGSILILSGVIVLLHVRACMRFDQEIAQALQDVTAAVDGDVRVMSGSEEISVHLPELVRQFARKSGASDDIPVRGIYLEQDAELRMGPDKPWRRVRARQSIAVFQPGFVWDARQVLGPMTIIRIMDAYLNGAGVLKARLFGSIPVADLSQGEADRDELMRYLAELAWAPDAVLHNKALGWRRLDERTVEVSADSRGTPVSVRLYFNEAGDICEIQADARGGAVEGATARPWIGRFSAYEIRDGRRIPTCGEVGYIYDTGYAAYWRGRITTYKIL
ncbi:DUF6544 family protein [Paremcibacter congregatus]|uniref:Uncharacterized protein n=1 Tax=Paremcibacter congregatus TaxID=2043170 RepID=A0A2G4YVV4_9PROT|nr:DUF6544 family protein [Paremcibacter congregatus]PHZ86472.1 hypothetical protein CRD36_00870 [Paremcibacter congregatus]QDE28432.1 hypothetical protein FIV45_14725 [Paremcibacter congregatus]